MKAPTLSEEGKKSLLEVMKDDPIDRGQAIYYISLLRMCTPESPRIAELKTKWNISDGDVDRERFKLRSADDVLQKLYRMTKDYHVLSAVRMFNYRFTVVQTNDGYLASMTGHDEKSVCPCKTEAEAIEKLIGELAAKRGPDHAIGPKKTSDLRKRLEQHEKPVRKARDKS